MNKIVHSNMIRNLRLLNSSLLARASKINCPEAFSVKNAQNVSVRNPSNVQSIRMMSASTNATATAENSSVEKTDKKVERHDFMAETKQLLNIVAKSLYSEKEVFIRELISNSSDAIEKLKYAQLSQAQSADNLNQTLFEIKLEANDITNTLTIQDTGVGMTKAELIKNLGTIAHSGSKAFLEKLSKEGGSSQNVIGQFGVGFYSAFMVADKVEVFSQSYLPGEKGFQWSSTGDGSYEISECEGLERGTKIVMHLKKECNEFAKEDNIRRVVNKYSNFVGHPIIVNGDRINLIQPIWCEDAKNVTEEQHTEFYQFLGNFDKPRYTLQYKTDAPINIRSIFYIPTFKPAPGDVNQEQDIGVSLYSKKVLILAKANQILPRWLRFVKGVVDSEDIPLNLSRELLQDGNLIRRMKTILTQRILRFLNEKSKEDESKYMTFYNDYNLYFKEAIMRTMDQNEKEEIASLLRFESNKTEQGVHISLNDYVKRMKPDQKNIFFFAAPSRELAINSPYFEVIKNKDIEVLFLFEPYDEMIILQLSQFQKKNLVGIEQETVAEKNKDDIIIEGDTRSLNNTEAVELKEWLKNTLMPKIKNVKINNKLESHPCVVTTENMGMVRYLIKSNYFQREKVADFYGAVNLSLDINPRNNLIKALYTFHKQNPELAKALAEQLLDNSLVSAGLIEDPRLVLSNLNKLLEKAFTSK